MVDCRKRSVDAVVSTQFRGAGQDLTVMLLRVFAFDAQFDLLYCTVFVLLVLFANGFADDQYVGIRFLRF